MHALVVILALLAVPITAEAQPAGRVRTVGLLQLAGAVAAAARAGADALSVLGDPMFNRNRDRLIQAAAQHRLPAIWEWRTIVEAGGLMAYAPRLEDLQRRAATYVDRIFKGAKPGELPVEQPTTFDLAINLKTARALGLILPRSLSQRADHVID